jgi:hypothetical protein
LFGAAVAMPRLIAGLGNVAARGLLRATASSLGPAIASAAAGLLVRMSPLPFAERGLITAVLMTVVYVVVVWFAGPPWVRALVRERGTVAVARNAA